VFNMTNLLLLLPGAFFAPVIHEFVKARVSAALGDRTPKHNGFQTLNPFKYFEPIGFFLMLFFGVGWGRPVTTSAFYYKNKKQGVILTYATPMIVNLLIGMAAVFVASVVHTPSPAMGFGLTTPPVWVTILHQFGRLNIQLAVFNLFPVAPLAMNKILQVFVSPSAAMWLNNYEKPMQIVLFLLMIFGIVGLLVWTISSIFIVAASLPTVLL